ncbi:hypothetical protein ACRYGZ_08990 [Mycobacteroides abscessus]
MSDLREGLLFPNLLTRSERRELDREPEPRFLYQSMGAGWQSTAIALLAAQGVIEKPRFAVFADTGWEPPEVYAHLARLDEEVLAPAGIALVRVRAGSIYDEALDPHFPRSLPLYTRDPKTGEPGGITSRTCTTNFKMIAIYRWLREQLGAKVSEGSCTFCSGEGQRNAPWLVKYGHEKPWGICSVCRGTGTVRKVGAPPQGVWARSYVGFSADEMGRISPSRVSYAFDTFPLVGRDQNGEVVPPDLSMSRHDCGEYNTRHGFPEVMKSACIGCPWHSDAEWIRIKQDERQWQQVVDLDRSIRNTPGLDNEAFLHKSRIPIEDVTFESADDVERPSCSPYGCRSGLDTDSVAPPSLFDDDWIDLEETA